MTEQNLLDYNLFKLAEIHNHNNLRFNFFTEQPKALLNAEGLFMLPPIVQQQQQQEEAKVLDQSKQQWKSDVSQPDMIMDDDNRPSTPKVIITGSSKIRSNDEKLTHIVSPEAILEALQEESEETIGYKPFSRFTSFHALKERRYSTEASVSIPCSSPPNEEPQTSTPVKLKRPPNAYLLFNRDMRRELLNSSRKMTAAEISKEIGDSWKALPADQREYYIKTASRLKKEHLQKYPNYIYTRRSKAQLAEDKRLGKRSKAATIEKINYHYEYADTLVNPNKEEEEDVNKKRPRKFVPKNGGRSFQKDPRGRKKKRTSHPFAPKHPMSAYLYYVASVYQKVSSNFPGSTVGPISKSISKTWHALSPEERLPWTQKAESDKARYAREMQVYMANEQQKNIVVSSSDDDDDDDGDVDAHTLKAVVNMVNNSPNGNPMYHKSLYK